MSSSGGSLGGSSTPQKPRHSPKRGPSAAVFPASLSRESTTATSSNEAFSSAYISDDACSSPAESHSQRVTRRDLRRQREAGYEERKCRWVENIDHEYALGSHVMPSTHRGQEVLFGIRRSDQLRCVVKVREKLVSFKDQEDVTQWVAAMELLLSLQNAFSENITKIYDLFHDQRNYYCVMEQIDGLDLFELVHKIKLHDRNPYEKILFIQKVAYETCCGLRDYASQSLAHKDIKLENIVLAEPLPPQNGNNSTTQQGPGPDARSQQGQRAIFKVIDFDTVEKFGPDILSMDIMGTDQYIAPEAYAGYYSSASDVFALGALMFKLVTRHFPFHEAIFDDEAGQNYVGHPRMKEIRMKLEKAKIDYSHRLFEGNRNLKDFVKRCLDWDFQTRISVYECLEHPFLQNYETESKLLRPNEWMQNKRGAL